MFAQWVGKLCDTGKQKGPTHGAVDLERWYLAQFVGMTAPSSESKAWSARPGKNTDSMADLRCDYSVAKFSKLPL